MQLPLRKHPGITIVVVLIVIGLVYGFWPQPVMVDVASVKRGPMTVTIEEEGRTRVIDRYIVDAPVAGVACRIALDVGDNVEKGQVLVQLEPMRSQVLDPRSRAEAKARVSAAESALQAAQEEAHSASANADFAAKDLERIQKLAEQGLVSRDSLDRARTQARSTKATERSAIFAVKVARYELEAARTALEYSAAQDTGEPQELVPIRAPISGRILKVPHECEGVVNAGEPMIEIGDPSALEVEVDVLSPDAVRISPGTKVIFERWGGEDNLQGVVRLVEPVGFTKISALGVEEQRVLVIADITSPAEQWQKLGDGYRVEASFILWQKEDVLQVPSSALFRVNDNWAVFVVENERAVRRIVKVGQRTGLIAQILEGLQEGETVISHPSDEVEDGVRIKAR